MRIPWDKRSAPCGAFGTSIPSVRSVLQVVGTGKRQAQSGSVAFARFRLADECRWATAGPDEELVTEARAAFQAPSSEDLRSAEQDGRRISSDGNANFSHGKLHHLVLASHRVAAAGYH